MMFNTRIAYTRKQIGQVVGGSLKVPFPSKDGRVVAICLSRDTNPDAPQRIRGAERREPPGEDGRIDRREAGHAAEFAERNNCGGVEFLTPMQTNKG